MAETDAFGGRPSAALSAPDQADARQDPLWVDIDGADNFRDLGGLPTLQGGRTRRGVLYRSGTLQDLPPVSTSYLVGECGIRTVIDLRLPAESRVEGSALADIPGVKVALLPLWGSGPTASTALVSSIVPDANRYARLMAGSQDSLIAAVRLLADAHNLPAVFHCAAGMDRTGVLAAVVLDAVGVTREGIVRDYLASQFRLAQIRQRLRGLVSYEPIVALLDGPRWGVSAATMEQFLDSLREQHGGSANWLLRRGVHPAELESLTASLLEPAEPGT